MGVSVKIDMQIFFKISRWLVHFMWVEGGFKRMKSALNIAGVSHVLCNWNDSQKQALSPPNHKVWMSFGTEFCNQKI